MKRGKIRAEKFSNHINVLRIQKGIFLFTSFLTCTVLYLAYKFTLNTDLFIVVGRWKKCPIIWFTTAGLLWRCIVVMGNISDHLRTQHEFPWIETCSEEIPWSDALTQTFENCCPKIPDVYASCLLKTFINRKIWIISTFLQRAVTETDLTLYLHRG